MGCTDSDNKTLHLVVDTPSSVVSGRIDVTPLLVVQPGASGDGVIKIAGDDVPTTEVTVAHIGENAVDVTVDKADKDSVYTAAEEFARITRLQYEVGMATKAQVTAADVAVASAKYGLLALQCNHDLLVRAMQKPWAASVITSGLSGGSASSSMPLPFEFNNWFTV
ncbi:MAG: hypothetical protein ACPLTR_10695 [Thermacetogeniaceae bacterium]